MSSTLDPMRHHRRRRPRVAAVLAVAALLLGACAGDDATTGPDADADGRTDAGTDAATELSIAIASFDLAAGEDRRLLAGVFTPDRQLLGFGDVAFQLGYLGDGSSGETEIDQEVTASFLPVAGMGSGATSDGPTLLDDPDSQGVYAGRVDFTEPGIYGLRVIAELDDGRRLEGATTFSVAADRQVPDVGDPAPRTENLTIADVEAGRVAPIAVDSRAQDPDAAIPDPQLHDQTVADSLEAGRPVVVAITTPVYCASRFCGPLTEVMAELADEYADRADVIHIEVWEDFEEQQLNAAAAEWIQTEAGGNEPWTFLVDADGAIVARWDNVLDTDELTALLDELPVIGPPAAATTDS